MPNGITKEVARWLELIAAALDADFFAHPYASRERGTNENMNGLIRQFLTQKMRFAPINSDDIGFATHSHNHCPRKRLGFKTHGGFMKQLHPEAATLPS